MPPIPRPGPVPREALDYFRRKKLRVGFNHTAVWREEHRAAFTVAGIASRDILDSIRGYVDNALEGEILFRDFANELGQLLADTGWVEERPQSTPSRLRVIYQTNLRVARAAGQWQRIDRTKKTLPFLIYELGPSTRHRPQHVSWEGTILPVDDPFWGYAMPPNGFGCKCGVRQVGRAEAGRDEFIPQGSDTPVPLKRDRPPKNPVRFKNPKTGKTELVPAGIQVGSDYNPGQDRMKGVRDAAKDAA